jgi:PhnB protein
MSAPKGFRTLTPYPIVQDVPGMIVFMREVFGAEETFRAVGSAGGYHGEVRIGDCMMMIGGGGPDVSWFGESRPMAFHVYVPDVDATYRRALAAGAASLQEPTNQPWGERTANVKDPSGNNWYIATFQGDNYYSEGAPTLQPFLHPKQCAPIIEFMIRAFGAEETGRATSSEGTILHSTVKIGDAAVEFGDATGIYQPMPGMFYLYVPDVDAVYRRALEAGATSISAPVDQSYGDRCGGAEDSSGNKWYIATHIAETAGA